MKCIAAHLKPASLYSPLHEKKLLHEVIFSYNYLAIEWVLKQGFNVNVKDDTGQTALFKMAYYHSDTEVFIRKDILRLLIRYGAELDCGSRSIEESLQFRDFVTIEYYEHRKVQQGKVDLAYAVQELKKENENLREENKALRQQTALQQVKIQKVEQKVEDLESKCIALQSSAARQPTLEQMQPKKSHFWSKPT
jgi:hypothetical protein